MVEYDAYSTVRWCTHSGTQITVEFISLQFRPVQALANGDTDCRTLFTWSQPSTGMLRYYAYHGPPFPNIQTGSGWHQHVRYYNLETWNKNPSGFAVDNGTGHQDFYWWLDATGDPIESGWTCTKYSAGGNNWGWANLPPKGVECWFGWVTHFSLAGTTSWAAQRHDSVSLHPSGGCPGVSSPTDSP